MAILFNLFINLILLVILFSMLYAVFVLILKLLRLKISIPSEVDECGGILLVILCLLTFLGNIAGVFPRLYI